MTMSSSPPAPIAIIGMGCRLPGGVNSPSQLWDLVSSGGSGWGVIPPDRWNASAFYHPDLDAKESINSQHGYFLHHDLRHFDAHFFNVPLHEAHTMDPQQRVLLETAYQALEDAGLPAETLRGSDTAVFVGVFGRDYNHMGYKDLSFMSKAHTTGTGDAILSNRISYALDLKGASMSIDTGCSASMVALHQAVLTLRSGESRMAIAGGVELLVFPDQSITLSSGGLSNPEGRCYFLDSRGSGYARGEGAGLVVLKRLDHALQDGDNIHAVILNSCLNQDGKTGGISLPSADAQAALMKKVYIDAGVDPTETLYVEAHGTGTQAGDHAELTSIAKALCGNARDTELYVGSVKCNIGHLEAASGVAGLIHTTMALKRCLIPPNINFIEPKSSLNLDEWDIKVPLELRPLVPQGYDGPVRASVNGFGYGGTNGHILLESIDSVLRHGLPSETSARCLGNSVSLTRMPLNLPRELRPKVNGIEAKVTNGTAPNGHSHVNGLKKTINEVNSVTLANGTTSVQQDFKPSPSSSSHSAIFPLSAASETALSSLAANLHDWLEHRVLTPDRTSSEETAHHLQNLAYTLGTRRSLLSWRAAVVASNKDELLEQLLSVSTAPGRRTRCLSSASLTFVFTGQGAQWHAMGRELILSGGSKRFRDSIVKSDGILRDLGCSWSLVDELTGTSSRIGESDVSQPATTAIQIALVDLLGGFGVEPHAVVGHSSGEIAAAYAAGVLSHEAAMSVAFYRGIFSFIANKVNRNRGAMLAVGAPEESVPPLFQGIKSGRIRVACINSPASVTISGDESAIDELQGVLNESDIFCRKLKVETAYHSHHMETIANQYRDALSYMSVGRPQPGGVRFYSSVTGKAKTSGFGADYWTENLVSKVRFSGALEALIRDSHSLSRCSNHILVEIGPHSALSGPVRQILKHMTSETAENVLADLKHFYIPTLVRNKHAMQAMLGTAGRLFELGSPAGHSMFSAILADLDHSDRKHQLVQDLPTYPWDHSTEYWHESRISRDHRHRKFPTHDLVGLLDPASSLLEPRWRHHISLRALPWLRHHVVDDITIFPGAGYIAMAIEAVKQLTLIKNPEAKIERFTLRNITLSKPVVLQDQDSLMGDTPEIELMLSLSPDRTIEGSSWHAYRVLSYGGGISGGGSSSWSEHSTGLIRVETVSSFPTAAASFPGSCSAQKILSSFQAKATEAVSATEFYDLMSRSGNVFGPSFRGITDMAVSEAGSVPVGCATITIQDLAEHMPKQYMQPHVIHPATLDAINQLSALLFKRRCVNAPIMPTFIGEMTLTADISTLLPGGKITVGMELFPEGKTAASGNTWAFRSDTATGELSLVSTTFNWRMQSIGDDAMVSGGNSGQISKLPFDRRINFRPSWIPDVDFLSSDQLHEHVLPPHAKAAHPDSPEAQAITARLWLHERAAAVYARDTLTQLDAVPLSSSSSSSSSPPLPAHLAKWLAWMRHHVSLPSTQALLASTMLSAELSQVLNDSAASGVEGQLLARIGRHAPDILRDERSALALMVEGDGLLGRFYADAEIFPAYAHLSSYVAVLALNAPRLRVLEIGAGTGGATAAILDAIDEVQEGEGATLLERYTYTDVSASFFEKARERFGGRWGHVLEYRTLDIAAQETEEEEGSYDLVVASNVLHATPDMRQTLRNVRRLMREGGRLVLVELTHATAATMTIFGSLPGWWGFEDERTGHPLLSRAQWHDVLKETGFGGIEVSSRDVSEPSMRSIMMVAKAVGTGIPSAIPDAAGTLGTASKGGGKRRRATILTTGEMEHETRETLDLAEGLRTALADSGWSSASVASLHHHHHHQLGEADGDESNTQVFIVLDAAERSILAAPTEVSFARLKSIITTAKNILWISASQTSSPHLNAVKAMQTGLGRVIRREYEGTKFVTLDVVSPLSGIDTESLATIVQSTLSLATAVFPLGRPPSSNRKPEPEYRLTPDGRLLIPRLRTYTKFNTFSDLLNGKAPMQSQPYQDAAQPIQINVAKRGLLSSLRFIPFASAPLAADELEIASRAFHVTPRDAQLALGKLRSSSTSSSSESSLDHMFLSEVAGIVTAVGTSLKTRFQPGDRVLGLASRPLSSHARVRGDLFACRIPDSIPTFAGAVASVPPLTAMTAWYALVETARLGPGHSLLVQAADTPLGHFAVQIALRHVGVDPSRVFATVSSSVSTSTIVPIPERNLFWSGSTDFQHAVLQATSRQGVDVVLNALPGEMLAASWACVAPLGIHVEVSLSPAGKTNYLPIGAFDKGATFAAVDVPELIHRRPDVMGACFDKVMHLVRDGIISPYVADDKTIMGVAVADVEAALRAVGDAHTPAAKYNQVVLEVRGDEIVQAVAPMPEPLRLHVPGTYVIAGGLGDLGRRIAQHLARLGAGHVVSLSRRDISDDEKRTLQADVESAGAKLYIVKCDITHPDSVGEVAAWCNDNLPPVRGVIHGGMVLRDRLFADMTHDDYTAALGPKVTGTANLDAAFGCSPDLDFFIMLSSLTSIMGKASQANYSAGNSYEDEYAHSMSAAATFQGKKVRYVSLNLGVMGGSSSILSLPTYQLERLQEHDIIMTFDELFRALEFAMADRGCVQAVMGIDRDSMEAVTDDFSLDMPLMSALPLKRLQRGGGHSGGNHNNTGGGTGNHGNIKKEDIETQLRAAKTLKAAEKVIAGSVVEKLSRFLGRAPADVVTDQPMSVFGLDSLVGIELKNWMVRTFAVRLQAAEVTDAESILALAVMLARRSKLVDDGLKVL